MQKISVIIITKDEEENLEDCLESVLWADEIILVDSGSKDKTLEIAKNFNAKIFHKEWEGFANQKRYALNLANNEIVLSIDADERITEKLKDEILNLDFSKADGFSIPRQNYFLNKEITTCGWDKDYQLRLFKKSKTKVIERPVHEGFSVKGKVEKLQNKMIHFTHTSIAKTFEKINLYSTLQAQERHDKKVAGIGILAHSFSAFFRFFISLKGYKDGIHGLMVSLMNSVTTMLTYMKIWEMNNSKPENERVENK